MEWLRGSVRLARWRNSAMFVVAYLAAMYVGLHFVHGTLRVSPFWPASGVAVIGVLQLGPGVLVILPIVDVIVSLGHQPVWVSLVIGSGAAVEAMVMAAIYRRLAGDEPVPTSLRGLGAFAMAAAFGAATGATSGTIVLQVSGLPLDGSPQELWATWWAADFLAGILIGTLLLAWLHQAIRRPRPVRVAEFIAACGFVFVTGCLIFINRTFVGLARAPVTFLVFPGVVWAAFRFGQRGASAAAVLLWTIALFATATGQGPFALTSPALGILATQGFIVVLALTGLAVGGEVTRRQLFERRLEQSEQRYRTLIAHSPEAICVLDAKHGRLIDANAAAERLFALRHDELVGTDLRTLSAPMQPGGRDADETISALLGTTSIGVSQRFEWLHRRRDGSTVPCEMRLTGLPGTEPRVRASIVDLSDRPFFAQVTVLESLVRGAPLDDALTQLATLLEAQMPDGRAAMFARDANSSVLLAVAAPSFPAEFLDVSIPHPVFAHAPHELSRTGGFAHEISDVFVASGWEGVRPLAARWGFRALWIWPCFDTEGGILGAVSMLFTSSTRPSPSQRALLGMAASLAGLAMQRHNAERSLRVTELQLRQAQKMDAVGRLAGGVAHDFNNLLTVISAATELLAEQSLLDGAAMDEIRMVREATDRATGLTRQLMTFSRQQPWQPTRLDLNEAIRRIDSMLRRVVGANQTIQLALDATLPPTLADETQIQQVLLNLCVNARDAMPLGGTIRITTRALADEPPGMAPNAAGWISLEVRDQGDGIPAGLETRIFEPFFTTKAPGAGTGLGLATVYGIVEQAGGAIVAANAPEGGAVFTVTLPAAFGADIEVVSDVEATPATAGAGERILLVEDEPTLRRLTARVLRRAGYVVEDAPDAEVALRRLHEGLGVDLVLTDVVMPGRSGAELGRRIAAMSGPPVLYTSGYTEDTVLLRQIREDGLPFLPKPFTVDKLLSSVRALLASVA